MAAFTPQIQSYILASEGGYVDHKDDPGGATNMGITFNTLKAWRGKPVTKQDVRNLTKKEALDIYEAQ
jgi:lysozyme family protein